MADNPEVPDIKKAIANKPAGFNWTPEGPVAKSAASGALAVGRPPAPTFSERILELSRGRLALFGILLVVGGFVFSYAAFRFAGGVEGSSPNLGGLTSTGKVHFGRKDSTGLIPLESRGAGASAGNAGMRFDLIGDAADKAAAAKQAADQAIADAQAAAGGAQPMNYDDGATSHGSGVTSGNIPGGLGAGGKGAAQGDVASSGPAPKLTGGAFGSIKFQGMRRTSDTAGFRNIAGSRGVPSRTIHGLGPSANTTGAANAGGVAGGHGVTSSGGATNGAGLGSGSAPGGGSGSGGGGDGGGGGGGGGAGAAPNTAAETLTGSVVDQSMQIAQLTGDAQKHWDKAEDDKKMSIAFKATGQDPQAVYYYEEYKKEKKAGDDKKAEADKLSAAMHAQSATLH